MNTDKTHSNSPVRYHQTVYTHTTTPTNQEEHVLSLPTISLVATIHQRLTMNLEDGQ